MSLMQIGPGLCLAGLGVFLLSSSSTQAGIITNPNAIITSAVGGGGVFWNQVVDQDNNLELDLRARLWKCGDNDAANGKGDYALSGKHTGTYHCDWQIEFSINSNPLGEATPSSGFTFYLVADYGKYTWNLSSLTDNRPSGSAIQNSIAIYRDYIDRGTTTMLPADQRINILGDSTTAHTFTLLAEDATGKIVLRDTITVNGGVPAPVPEPTTVIAGALLLLPFGAKAFRSLLKRK